MPAHYFKRYRLAYDLTRGVIGVPALPDGYHWVPWQPGALERHARTKFESFREEVDAEVFECLGELAGCHRLMHDIAETAGFCREATWLVEHHCSKRRVREDCGTIQGVAVSDKTGSIQNVGVVPNHRGHGLGRALILRALAGFQQQGLQRVTLEVTANNTAAVHLYRHVGFRTVRTMFREVGLVEA